MIESIHHIAIIATDYLRSKSFYTDVLGFSIIRENYRADRNSYKLDLALNGNYVIELFSFPNPPKRPSKPEAAGLRHLAFKVTDISQSRKSLLQKGIPVHGIRVDEFTGKKFCFFNDPDGLPLELYES